MDNKDRISVLIEKLKEQNEKGVPAQYIAVTAQMLLTELSVGSVVKSQGVSAVVIAPVTHVPDISDLPLASQNIVDNKAPEVFPVEKVKDRFSIPFTELPEIPFLKQTIHSQVSEPVNEPAIQSELKSEPIVSVPVTVKSLSPPAEIHEALNTETESNLNEKLKEEKKELASLLNETPIADLRKAIGINDRFVFIQELFNGDETMYERCIKTINSFTLYPEAAGWIQRELKVKLGWKEDSEPVQDFDQLVMRRFS